MAEIVGATVEFVDVWQTVWPNLANGDSGVPFGVVGAGDRTVQINGTFGVGGTVVVEGTLDKVPVPGDASRWFTLNDLQTLAISKTAAALEGIAESVLWVRPRVTAGDGTTSITVTMIARTK